MNDMYFEDFHAGLSFTSRTQVITRERIVRWRIPGVPPETSVSDLFASQWNQLQ